MVKNKFIHYFHISWNSNTDGKGLRTVVYLQGCNLQCNWCHSPHSQPSISPILLNINNCNLCKNCVISCKQNVHLIKKNSHQLSYKKCISCGECITNCPNSNNTLSNISENALFLPTKKINTGDLFNKIQPQLELLKNIGGLTLSGGEPLLQYNEISGLLKNCKDNGIHTTIETSASVPFQNFQQIYQNVDEWLFGIRPVEKNKFGNVADIDLVINNVKKLSALNNKNITIRTPIINNVIHTKNQMAYIISIMKDNNLSKIELLPFNPYTTHYYTAMGKKFNMPTEDILPEKSMAEIQNQFEKEGIKCKIIITN